MKLYMPYIFPSMNAQVSFALKIVLAIFLSIASVFPSSKSFADNIKPIKIVATTGMIGDAVKAIGANNVEVKTLMGSGVDPHAYRQTRSDISALVRADLVFRNGLYLEAQMEDFFRKLEKKGSVVTVSEGIDPRQLKAHDHYKDRFDPHIWMDPALWLGAVARIRDALIEARPQLKDELTQNADTYMAKISALDEYAKQVTSTIDKPSRILVTAHDAFGYFGRAFDFEVIGIQGISTNSEAGLKRISDLVDLLVTRNISAVFVETSVSDRNIRALIEGAASKGHKVSVGGELYSDALGKAGSFEGTYEGMIDHNVTSITRALGGNAPKHGLNSRISADN